jgi:conjugal transfer pilus assembly protein TraF
MISPNLYAAFFDNHAEGWHWYQDPILEKQIEEVSQLDLTKPMTDSDTIKAYQKELEAKVHKALLQPTHKNVQAYQEMQKDLTDRSQKFSETWMQVVFQNPHLDHTLVSPVNQKGRHIYLDQEKQHIKETILDLKDQYGMNYISG